MKFGRIWPFFAFAFGAACAPPIAKAPEPEPAAESSQIEVALPAATEPPVRHELPISPRAKRLAENVLRAFSNVEPRPVIREMAQQPWVLFQTDRTVGRPLGPLAWREAPVRVLHGRTEIPTQVEPCAKPLVLGEAGQARGGSYRLARGEVFDRVYVDGDKIAVKLPPGAFHGGCLVDEKRLWIAWSTPARPADLFTITLKDGAVRPLRDEARPSLGGLSDVLVTAEDGVLLARRGASDTARAPGIVVLVEPSDAAAALGAFSPLVRAFVEEGYVVLRRREGAADEAKAATLVDDLVRRDRAPLGASWTARLAAPPAEPPPHTLWIDPADRERTLAQALTLLSPEPTTGGR